MTLFKICISQSIDRIECETTKMTEIRLTTLYEPIWVYFYCFFLFRSFLSLPFWSPFQCFGSTDLFGLQIGRLINDLVNGSTIDCSYFYWHLNRVTVTVIYVIGTQYFVTLTQIQVLPHSAAFLSFLFSLFFGCCLRSCFQLRFSSHWQLIW